MREITVQCRSCGASVKEVQESRKGRLLKSYECSRCGYAWGTSTPTAKKPTRRAAQ